MCHCCCGTAVARGTEHSGLTEKERSPGSTAAKAEGALIVPPLKYPRIQQTSPYAETVAACLPLGKKGDNHVESSRTGVRIAPGPHPVPSKALGIKGQVKESHGKEKEKTKRQRKRGRGREEDLRPERQPGSKRSSLRQLSHPHNQWGTLPCAPVPQPQQCPSDRDSARWVPTHPPTPSPLTPAKYSFVPERPSLPGSSQAS